MGSEREGDETLFHLGLEWQDYDMDGFPVHLTGPVMIELQVGGFMVQYRRPAPMRLLLVVLSLSVAGTITHGT